MEAEMACPKCNKAWREVKDNKLFCECGYIEEIKITYNELLKKLEAKERIIKELRAKIKEYVRRLAD